MKIIQKVKSWNNSTNLDCFGNGNPNDSDHIYPESLGGSNKKINKQKLSIISNAEKKNKTKGKIGSEWRFAILKQIKGDVVFGVMFIRNKNWPQNHWQEVTPIQ